MFYTRVMTSGQARGPYAKSALQRQNILAAARRVFARLGYNGSSMRGIAEEAGITFTGLRHYFGTKDELLIAVLEERDREHQIRQADIHGIDLLDGLADLLESVLAEPGITEVFTTLSGEAVGQDHPAHQFFTERYRRVRSDFANELNSARTTGTPLPIAAESAAMILVAAMDGLQLQSLLDHEIDVRAAFDDLLGLLRGRDASPSPVAVASEGSHV